MPKHGMVNCVVYGCSNRTTNKKTGYQPPAGITFHRFPKDNHLRKKWTVAVGRKNWEPMKWSHMCSAHFREEDIDRTSLACVRLREGAVPCVFPAQGKERPKEMNSSKRTIEEIDTFPTDRPETLQVTQDQPHLQIENTPEVDSITSQEVRTPELPFFQNPWFSPPRRKEILGLPLSGSAQKRDSPESTPTCVPSKRPKPEAECASLGDEECDMLGRLVAVKLRKMDCRQRLHADKLITDVLYKGMLGKLTES